MRSTPTGSSARPGLAQLVRDLAGDVLGDAGVGVERAAQGGDAGAGPVGAVEPRVVELVVLGGRPEVPDDRLAAAGQQREPDQLVHRPRADVGRRHVADVGEVEGQQGAELRAVQRLAEPGQPLLAQVVEVDSPFPVDGVGAERADRHRHALPLAPGGRDVFNAVNRQFTNWRSAASSITLRSAVVTFTRHSPRRSSTCHRPRYHRSAPGCAPRAARRGLSVRGLARDIGVSASLISQIETDKSSPSVSTLYAITTALGISIEDLFGDPPAGRTATLADDARRTIGDGRARRGGRGRAVDDAATTDGSRR